MKELILQDIILNQVRREKSVINIKLVNGDNLSGTIRGFDGETLIIDDKQQQTMIYKYNIMYVCTEKPVLRDMNNNGI